MMTELPPPAASTPAEAPRRNFLARFASMVIGGVVGLVPVLAGAVFFLDPLRKKNRSVAAAEAKAPPAGLVGFMKVGSADQVKLNGPPQLFKVIADRFDAWNYFPQEPIGAVYIRQTEKGYQAFNVVCPHLGCAVDYKPGTNSYLCPCHNSSFSIDGERSNQTPPRGLDDMEVQVVDNELWVKFQNFRTGEPHKIPKV